MSELRKALEAWCDECVSEKNGYDIRIAKTVLVREYRTINDLLDLLYPVIEAASYADCACTLSERQSGHLIGCFQPELNTAMAEIKSKLEVGGS